MEKIPGARQSARFVGIVRGLTYGAYTHLVLMSEYEASLCTFHI